MLISIDGIDGCGKSTTAHNVFNKLNVNQEFSVFLIDKKAIRDNANDFGLMNREYFNSLSYLSWEYTNNHDYSTIPIKSWIYLQSAWFTYVYDSILIKMQPYDIVLIDGWLYKLFARMMVTSKDCYNFILNIVKTIPHPDMSIFLDLKSEKAWERKKGHFNDCELGILNDSKSYYANLNDKRSQFIRFQDMVRVNLIKLFSYTSYITIDNNCHSEENVCCVVYDVIKNNLHVTQK